MSNFPKEIRKNRIPGNWMRSAGVNSLSENKKYKKYMKIMCILPVFLLKSTKTCKMS